MESKMLRGGIIGFGKMGLLHGAIINALEKATLRAVCESNDTIRGDFSSLLPKVNFYKNYSEMLEKENLDFVFVTTPPSSHVEIGLECVKYKCHFFIEKPLCINAYSAKPLLDAVEKHPLVTMVGFMMRYLDTFKRAKEILEKKVLGEIFAFNATTYVSQLFKSGKGWRYSPQESGGGVLIIQGIHAIDMLCWFFGMPRAVNARTKAAYSKKVEDFGHMVLSWENGLMGWLDSSWSVDNYRLLTTTFKINGENGTLFVDDDTVKLYLRKECNGFLKGWTVETKPELFSGVAIDIGGPHFTKQDEDFIDSIISDRRLESDIKNAYRIQKLIDCIYKSADSDGETVLIKESE